MYGGYIFGGFNVRGGGGVYFWGGIFLGGNSPGVIFPGVYFLEPYIYP